MIYTILLYLLAQPLRSPEPPPRSTNPVYIDLSVQVANGPSVGSGTIFQCCGRDALVLTCRHIFREGVGRIIITRRDGVRYPGSLWATSRSVDLAAVVIPTPSNAISLYARMNGGAGDRNWELVISTVHPREVLALGWGNGRLAVHRGSFLQPIGPIAEYAITPRSGDSGGGAWLTDGEFAGVIAWVDPASLTGGLIGPAAVRQFYSDVHLGRRRRAA